MEKTIRPRFTQKHYRVIAEALSKTRPVHNPTVRLLVGVFEKDNCRFNKSKFLRAVHGPDTKGNR